MNAPYQADAGSTPVSAPVPRGWRLSLVAGWAIGLGAIGALVHFADPWIVAAYTRVLDLLIGGGIIPLTDADEGFGRGVPDLELYVASQDPVAWSLVLVALVLLGLMTFAKALQFHRFCRLLGCRVSFAQSAFGYVHTHVVSRLVPFSAGWSAQATTLEWNGVEPRTAGRAVFLGRGFQVFETALFALVGLVLLGPIDGILLLGWPLVILALAVFLTTTREGRRGRARSRVAASRELGRSLLRRPATFGELALYSIAAFLLMDVAAYTVSQAFTSEHVILNAETSLILMGIVGGYIARLVPIAPGGLGQFEWGFALVLYTGGLGFPEAATITLLVSAARYVAGGLMLAVVFLVARSAERPRLETIIGDFAGRAARGRTQ
ncbi:MAG: hypothetical protein FJW96_11300 [Actinobacteria bacterium]|nr:hypothetical protein [Actinomycetota bacterium]